MSCSLRLRAEPSVSAIDGMSLDTQSQRARSCPLIAECSRYSLRVRVVEDLGACWRVETVLIVVSKRTSRPPPLSYHGAYNDVVMATFACTTMAAAAKATVPHEAPKVAGFSITANKYQEIEFCEAVPIDHKSHNGWPPIETCGL